MHSLSFNNVYITSYNGIIGSDEKNSNIKTSNKINDFYDNEKTFEKCEIKMHRNVINKILEDNNLIEKDIDIIIGGDLSNQISINNYAINNFQVSTLGVYSACASFIESLIISSSLISTKLAKNIITVTSSHNLVSERQFRFPVEYGVLRKKCSTYTATGAVAALVSSKKSNISIKDATIGEIFEYNIKDPNLIGAIMAPAAAETIINHLNNFNRKIDYYDLILTGDLGNVGLNILKDYLYEEFNIKANNIIDAGSKFYNNKLGEVQDGASGPAVLPLYFFYNILNKNKYKKILLVGTGSLHTPSLINQKIPIPSIAHAISIEVIV